MNKLTAWLAVFAWCSFIFLLSSRPGLAVASGYWDFATRKPAHIFVYFILYLLFFNALNLTFNKSDKKRIMFVSLIFTILYGVSDEIHQIFVPLREGKVLDIIFDASGGIFGVIWISKLQARVLNKLKNLQPNLHQN